MSESKHSWLDAIMAGADPEHHLGEDSEIFKIVELPFFCSCSQKFSISGEGNSKLMTFFPFFLLSHLEVGLKIFFEFSLFFPF